jgi:hypothetical protein
MCKPRKPARCAVFQVWVALPGVGVADLRRIPASRFLRRNNAAAALAGWSGVLAAA